MFNVFKLYARYKGSKTPFYDYNRNYTLVVSVGKFNRVVKAHAIDRHTGETIEGSQLHYADKAMFDRTFKVIKDKTHEG